MSNNFYNDKSVVTVDQVFDQFNNNNTIAPTTNEFDAVKGFFLRKTNGDHETANSLADTIIQVASANGINVMSMLDQLKDYNTTQVQQAVVSLINQTRGNTSILGFNKNKAPNPSVARNVLS